MQRSLSRRRLLQGVSLATLSTVAGCIADGSPSSDGASPDTESPTDSPTETPTATRTDAPATRTDAPATDSETGTATPTGIDDLDAWLADANGYDSQPTSVGARDTVEVTVGAITHDGTQLAFDPPVVDVTPGTTVVWRWADSETPHNVVAVDGQFDSGDLATGHDTTFRQTFDSTGTYPYVCEPHESAGMIGAVIVDELPSSGYPALDEWLAGVDAWDGSLTDRTDADTVSVTTGATGNGGEFSFAPVALEVTPGTTVSWAWTGDGGGHNVVFEAADIGTAEIYSDDGSHFEHTFDDPGVYRYACEPHHALGMRGGIVVTE